jgi:hypothetical protein
MRGRAAGCQEECRAGVIVGYWVGAFGVGVWKEGGCLILIIVIISTPEGVGVHGLGGRSCRGESGGAFKGLGSSFRGLGVLCRIGFGDRGGRRASVRGRRFGWFKLGMLSSLVGLSKVGFAGGLLGMGRGRISWSSYVAAVDSGIV